MTPCAMRLSFTDQRGDRFSSPRESLAYRVTESVGAITPALAAGFIDHPARHGAAVGCEVIVGRWLAARLRGTTRQIDPLAFLSVRKPLEQFAGRLACWCEPFGLVVGMVGRFVGRLSDVEHLVLPFVPMFRPKSAGARRKVHAQSARTSLRCNRLRAPVKRR